MNPTIVAIYEKGVLRLDRPIDLAEGSRVEVIVIPTKPIRSADRDQSARKTPAELIAEIAALPMESSVEGFSGEDHDQVLYGGTEPR